MNTTLEIQAQDTPKIGIAAVLPENLYAALQSVGTAIPNKPALPILANVVLIAKSSTITVIASNLENTQVVKIGAKIDIPFEITLPWRTLRDVMALANMSRIDIRVDLQTSIATFDQGNWKCNLKGMPYTDYPAIRTNDDATLLAIVEYEKLLELANIGKRHAASLKDNSRPVLQAAKIQITADALRYTSADGYSLFDATMAAETEESANYTALIPAEMLYKALTSAKKNPRLKQGYVSLYGTGIDETGRVNGYFFIEDSPLSTFESGTFPSIEFLDNSTPVGEIYEIHSVYKAVWGYRSAERLEFMGINEEYVAETKMSFLSHEKQSGEETRIDKWLPMKLETYRFAILNSSTELAEYLRHANKNANCCQIAKKDNMVIFSHEYDGGTMRVAFFAHHTGTELKPVSIPEEHATRIIDSAEQKIAESVDLNAIRYPGWGFEYTGSKIVHYALIDGDKCYTTLVHGNEKYWASMQQTALRDHLPKITIERPSHFTAADYWKMESVGSVRQLADAIERLSFAFGISENLPERIVCQFLNTDESPDDADIWQHIETESESVVESSTQQAIDYPEAENNIQADSSLEYTAGLPIGGMIETINGNIYEIVENEPQIIGTDGENTATIAYADIISLAISTESPTGGDSPTHEAENIALDSAVVINEKIIQPGDSYFLPELPEAENKATLVTHAEIGDTLMLTETVTNRLPSLKPGTIGTVRDIGVYNNGFREYVVYFSDKPGDWDWINQDECIRVERHEAGNLSDNPEPTPETESDEIREKVLSFFRERKDGVRARVYNPLFHKPLHETEYRFGIDDIVKEIATTDRSTLRRILDDLCKEYILQYHAYNRYSLVRLTSKVNFAMHEDKNTDTHNWREMMRQLIDEYVTIIQCDNDTEAIRYAINWQIDHLNGKAFNLEEYNRAADAITHEAQDEFEPYYDYAAQQAGFEIIAANQFPSMYQCNVFVDAALLALAEPKYFDPARDYQQGCEIPSGSWVECEYGEFNPTRTKALIQNTVWGEYLKHHAQEDGKTRLIRDDNIKRLLSVPIQ